MKTPRSLIINTPFEAPRWHWRDRQGNLQLSEGRRPASYDIFDTRENRRRTETLPLVERIRERVDAWRASDYAGVTTVTRSLLMHWHDQGAREYPFYFCQLEAIETLIWWVEAPADFKQGIFIPGDGGPWERICNKMATGTGKTTVMAMLVAWQVLNALTYPKRSKDFSKAIFIVAPGLTVKERLQVLRPGHPDNYYDAFGLCPSEALRSRLNQMELQIENWHTLMPLKEVERSVVKKGKESDKAFVRRVLGPLAAHKDIIVINDEAHHAYRLSPDDKRDRETKRRADEMGLDNEEATRWISGLDRIHAVMRIQRCFDLSATPFAPTGRSNTEQGLFDWIVSDFGLNDAIEAGLVKTPRVVVRDGVLADSKTLTPKLYHLYRDPEVGEDLNRRGAQPHEPLPALVQQAYTLLGADWQKHAEEWSQAGLGAPPVMLTVCNRTETAARIEHYFTSGDAFWPPLRDPARTLRIDSRVLDKAEIGETAASDKDYEARLAQIVEAARIPEDRKERLAGLKKEELLREIVDNVGKRGQAGQDLQNVISVAMLSEGWDAKNITHIMGLRAFTSQLLCEQVIGRGLRRVGYDTESVECPDGVVRELFRPEYVNVFGVPLSVFQNVDDEGEAPPPAKRINQIEALPERNSLEIRWPNVLRVDIVVRPVLALDWAKVETLRLDPAKTVIAADLAPALGGAKAWDQIREIDLEKLPEEFRQQHIVFKTVRKVYEQLRERFEGSPEYLAFQLIRLVDAFIASDKLEIPNEFHQEPLRRRILISLNMDRIVQHLLRHVTSQNQERIEAVFDPEFPIGSTRYMRTWYTSKVAEPTQKSQISHLVVDSTWEQLAHQVLERSSSVVSYARNERLGFQIYYMWNGAKRRYIPDLLIRFTNGLTLILEIKGQDTEQDRAKRAALDVWVNAVNARGGFGRWVATVIFEPSQIHDVVQRYGGMTMAHIEADRSAGQQSRTRLA
jgi:type III restriction enzyme